MSLNNQTEVNPDQDIPAIYELLQDLRNKMIAFEDELYKIDKQTKKYWRN